MPPFSTTNTQEADDAEIVAMTQAKSATRRATDINVSRDAKLRKLRISTQWAIVIHGALFVATGAAMIKANEYYRREALIQQEITVSWKR